MLTFKHIYPLNVFIVIMIIVLIASGCDTATEVDSSETAPVFTPLVSLATRASAAAAEAELDIRAQVQSVMREAAGKAGIEIKAELIALDLKYTDSLGHWITSASTPIVDPSANARREDILFVMIQQDDPPADPVFYRVKATDRNGLTELKIFDLDDRQIRDDELVATAVARLIAPCVGGTEGTFDDICKALDGTPSEECEGCWLIFTCCERYCTYPPAG